MFVNIDILIQPYNSFIYPFLTDGFVTLCGVIRIPPPTLNLYLYDKKRAVRIITFSMFDSGPLFKQINILKLSDLLKFQISIHVFMYKFHKNQ